MSKNSKSIISYFFELANDRSKARQLKGTEKGEKTKKYTILSIIYSIVAIAVSVVIGFILKSLNTEDTKFVLKIIMFILLVFLAVLIFILYSHSLNYIACQRIVNKHKSRFFALIIFLISVASTVLIIYFTM